ncbi:hypothetical protein LADH09A_006095 [Micromonospora sp. LAH09]|uniref:hypothetical protein n=1 Tax=Micromonospora cabrerizensis TaxID=2911213 RepID=UPI001EE80AF6|nr:hypothetical protein [Micromonospora cabrerizensis]MCG5472060.1 hypothetical protein [Micromonospora cabrerizensis]
MWTIEELEMICHALRAESEGRDDPDVGRRTAEEALIEEIEQEVEEYREWYAKHRSSESIENSVEPPEELRERLWLIGWMIYEASWQIVRWARRTDVGVEVNFRAAGLVERLAEVARILPWPHFAPRALGAIRAEALVASKRDTPQGYNEAFLLHKEVRDRYGHYVESHGRAPGRELELLGLEEIFLQLVLAETGTACRTAERFIGRWLDELDKTERERQWAVDDEEHWVEILYHQLSIGVIIGEQALDKATEIERAYGLVKRVGRDRLALRTAFRNPGIMTARAALHLLPLTYEMEAVGLEPGADYDNWEEMREATVRRFLKAYRAIEKPVLDDNERPVALIADHQRSVAQLRLNAALVLPGLDLPSDLDFADFLRRSPLDDDAAEDISAWLAEKDGEGKIRGNANAVGSVTMPAFLRGVRACRAERGVSGGYREWRERWFALDRYAGEDDRRERVERALKGG